MPPFPVTIVIASQPLGAATQELQRISSRKRKYNHHPLTHALLEQRQSSTQCLDLNDLYHSLHESDESTSITNREPFPSLSWSFLSDDDEEEDEDHDDDEANDKYSVIKPKLSCRDSLRQAHVCDDVKPFRNNKRRRTKPLARSKSFVVGLSSLDREDDPLLLRMQHSYWPYPCH